MKTLLEEHTAAAEAKRERETCGNFISEPALIQQAASYRGLLVSTERNFFLLSTLSSSLSFHSDNRKNVLVWLLLSVIACQTTLCTNTLWDDFLQRATILSIFA